MHSLFYFSFFVEWRWTFHKFIASSWTLSHLKGQTRFSPATVWQPHTHSHEIRNINVGLINDTRWNYSISVSVLIFSTGLKLTAAVVWHHVFHISRGPTRAKYVICIRSLPACLPALKNEPYSCSTEFAIVNQLSGDSLQERWILAACPCHASGGCLHQPRKSAQQKKKPLATSKWGSKIESTIVQ